MTAGRLQPLCVVFLSLALALAPLAHGSAMSAMQKTPATTAAAPAAGMEMSDGCDLCATDSRDMAASVCSAQCAMPGAILPSVAAPQSSPAVRSGVAADPNPAASHPPPDPYPPRTFPVG